MTRSFCTCCIGLLVLASARAQQPQPGTSPVAVQGARPNNVLKPVPAEGANFRHALASPTAPQIPWKSDPNFLKIPDRHVLRRNNGDRAQFTRADVYLHASRRRIAPVPVRSERHLHARDRTEFIRLYDGAWRVRRRAGLRLDRRRGHQHSHQVEPEYGAARNDPRPPSRIARRSRAGHRADAAAASVCVQPAERRRDRRAGQHLRRRRL